MPANTVPAQASAVRKGDHVVNRRGYLIEKCGRRWKLTYPDGGWQRTSTRRDAVRLSALHAEDYPGWGVEVQGGRPRWRRPLNSHA